MSAVTLATLGRIPAQAGKFGQLSARISESVLVRGIKSDMVMVRGVFDQSVSTGRIVEPEIVEARISNGNNIKGKVD